MLRQHLAVMLRRERGRTGAEEEEEEDTDEERHTSAIIRTSFFPHRRARRDELDSPRKRCAVRFLGQLTVFLGN